MPAIYLIRHGQASFGKENYDELSDLGKQQALRLGKVIGNRLAPFDTVALGGMWRHEQTARACLSGFDLDYSAVKPQVDLGWNEYDHQEILRVYHPEFETAATMMAFVRTQANPKAFFEKSFNSAVNRWMSGAHDSEYTESWPHFQDRVQTALRRVITNNPTSKSIAVFTSGGPISIISQSLLGVDSKHMMRMNWTLLNCGITKLVDTGSRVFLSSLNEHSHFEGAQNKHLITYT